jgi:hypothetical protein
MKCFAVLLALAALATPVFACEDSETRIGRDADALSWGTDVDVANHGDIRFYESTALPAESFQVSIDQFGSFECEVTLRKVSDHCLEIVVDWFPGNDSSGCDIALTDAQGKKIGTSRLFMSY